MGQITASDESAHACFRHQGQSFGSADHLVEEGMHEVEGPSELTSREVALPHLQGDALGGVPSIGTEAVRTGKSLHPKACLRQRLNRTGGDDKCGVQGECHGVVFWGSTDFLNQRDTGTPQ